MPSRGPKATPAPIQRLRGNPRKQKKMDAPEYETAIPEPPKELDAVAIAEWYRVADIMAGMKIITLLDRTILALYSQTYSNVIALSADAAKVQQFYTLENGYVQEHPLHIALRKQRQELAKYNAELGFSPTSRNKVQMVAGKTDEPTPEAKLAARIFNRRAPQPKVAKPV